MSMGKKMRMAEVQYEGCISPEDLDAVDEMAADSELAEELDGMRLYDPDWSNEFISRIAEMYADAKDEAFAEGIMDEDEAEVVAIEEVAAQTGYSVEEIRSILEEGSARLQDSMPE